MWVDLPKVFLEAEDRFVIAAVMRRLSMRSHSLTMASPSECSKFLRLYGTAGLDQARRQASGFVSPSPSVVDNVVPFPSGAA